MSSRSASTIQDLAPVELAHEAHRVLLRAGGRDVTGARLIYRALELEPREPLALRCLAGFLDQDGTEPLAAAVLEYALSGACPLNDEERDELDGQRFRAQWSWGFATHSSGETSLPEAAFDDRSQFDVREDDYRTFVGQILELAGSLEGACRAARTLVGALGGCLLGERGDEATLGDLFAEGVFAETADYREWLLGSCEELRGAGGAGGR